MNKLLMAVSIVVAPFCAYALDTGAEFLRIDTDARAVSMGSAYTATSDGVTSLGYNPAGLASVNSAEVGFSHSNWLMDSKHDFVGVGIPLGRRIQNTEHGNNMAVGLGLVRLSNGDMEVRNADRSAGGSFTSYDQAVTLGFAMGNPRMKGWGMGLAFKYIESSIAGEKARAVAADLGVNKALRTLPVTVGVSVQNLGTSMKYISQKDPLPLTFATGLAVSVIPGINLAMDIKRSVYDRQTTVSVGSEYAVISAVSLRTGYMMNKDFKNELGGVKGNFSAGAGLKFWGMNMDYAMQPYGELGNTQKISIRKKF